MSETPPKVQALHPPSDWLSLRARVAERLIRVADPVGAISDLFDLIAPELRLNALIFCDIVRNGRLQLVAHCGITKQQAASMADQFSRAAGGDPLMGHVPDVRISNDPRVDVLKNIGLGAYAVMPLDAGGHPRSILGFGRRWTDRFSDDELAFLDAVSGYFAAALERIRGEAERHAGEERLRLAMETAGFATFDHDVVTGQHYWSPELKTLFGFAPEAEITLGDLVRMAHPDDRRGVSDMLTESAHRFARGDFREYIHEHRIIRPDNELRWISVRGRTILREVDGRQRPVRVLGVVQDITDRKLAEDRIRASEERLRLAQELGGVASWDWVSSRESWVSDNYRRIHGLPPKAPVNWATFTEILHPEDREQALAQLRSVPRDGGYFDIEFRIVRPSDGEVRWIQTLGGVVQGDPDNTHVGGISMDITERKRDQERERLLTREVDHRAKNLLNVVQSMVQLTRADTIPEFIEEVIGRIHALARVHSLIAASRWQGASLATLVEDELTPFNRTGERLRMSGPSVELRPAAAQSMALVIHELTTNAVKHGALSRAGGTVEIRWALTGAGATELVLRWRESGGPPVGPPKKKGFGTSLIRGSIERHLGGMVDLDWRAEGFRCAITLPAKQLAATPRPGAQAP